MSVELIREELEAIRLANARGDLNPEEVVEFARNPNTALHSKFNWDDSEAARLYRLQQARNVIRVAVTIEQPDSGSTIVTPTFVSLSNNRGAEGGYRPRLDVINDRETRRRYLLDILSTVVGLITRANVPELQSVLDAAQGVRARIEEQRERISAR